jgi:addiction module HigA family antidote
MSIKRPEGGWKITRTPVHPGEMLREEFMKPLGISINALALELHVPVTRISEIVNERRGITADTALRLARHFGTSADFWMNLQKNYELILTQAKVAEDDRKAGSSAQRCGLRADRWEPSWSPRTGPNGASVGRGGMMTLTTRQRISMKDPYGSICCSISTECADFRHQKRKATFQSTLRDKVD